MTQESSYELKFLQAAEDSFQSYLLSNEIYWPLSVRPPAGSPPYPRFSLGWLLLYARRLAPFRQDLEVAEVLNSFEGIKKSWHSAWKKKAAAEFQSRLRLWAQFLNDYRRERGANASRYRYEVQRRTMLELLREEADTLPSEQLDLLSSLDAVLRGSLKPGDFLRDPEQANAFPKNRFWFLYGDLKS